MRSESAQWPGTWTLVRVTTDSAGRVTFARLPLTGVGASVAPESVADVRIVRSDSTAGVP